MVSRQAPWPVLAAVIVLFAGGSRPLHAADPLRTETRLAAFPGQSRPELEKDESPCQFASPSGALALHEAIERALCHSPETRIAWAQARTQAAMLGVARSAYLPSAAGSLGYLQQNTRSNYESPYDPLDASTRPRTRSANLKMSWTLADAGLRSANAEQAGALLDAANASHSQSIQRAFLDTAQRYFNVQTAQSVLQANREAELVAQRSLEATKAKYAAGVGALTDKLQAEVALSEARLKRVNAEGELKDAQGTLASTIGLSPDLALLIVDQGEQLPDTNFVRPIENLFAEARENHPAILAAQAEVKAARAKVDAVQAEGRPSLVLSAEANERRQDKNIPISGYPPTGASFSDKAIGVQLNVPLFEGFGRDYRVKAASGQLEQKQGELARIEQQVVLDIWKSYQAMNTRREHIEAARLLLDSAHRSFNVAEGRFRSGIGNILELLNAQSAVANAKQREIEARSGWLSARLQLAASIGKLGWWAIR